MDKYKQELDTLCDIYQIEIDDRYRVKAVLKVWVEIYLIPLDVALKGIGEIMKIAQEGFGFAE